jgi:antitoxin ParD1/3/4
MTITLTSEQEKFVSEQIKRGYYRSPDDVVAQGLGMLRDQEAFIRDNEIELREKIAVGLDQIRRGEVVEGKTVFRNIRAKLKQRGRGEK